MVTMYYLVLMAVTPEPFRLVMRNAFQWFLAHLP